MSDEASLTAAITAKGDEVREKKTQGEDISGVLSELKALKAKFEEVTGKSYDPPKKEKKKTKKKTEEEPVGGTEASGPSKNELKKMAKAAKKAEKRKEHQAAASGGSGGGGSVGGPSSEGGGGAAASAAAIGSDGYGPALLNALKKVAGASQLPTDLTLPNTVAQYLCKNAPAGSPAASLYDAASSAEAGGEIASYMALAARGHPDLDAGKLAVQLEEKSFLVGETLSLADVAVFTALTISSAAAVSSSSGALRRWCVSVRGFLGEYAASAAPGPECPPPVPSATFIAAARALNFKQSTRSLGNGDVAAKEQKAASTTTQEKKAKKNDMVSKKEVNKGKSPANEGSVAVAATSGADVTALDIRVGVIKKAWPHTESEKLWCEEIDIGEEKPRLIASGLRQFYTNASDLEGRTVLVVANLKAKKMAGFSSEGMVLCASDAAHETVKFVEAPAGSTPGERVVFEGLSGEPASAKQIQKKKIDQTIIFGGQLVTIDGGICTYKGKTRMMLKGGVVKAPVSAGFTVA